MLQADDVQVFLYYLTKFFKILKTFTNFAA